MIRAIQVILVVSTMVALAAVGAWGLAAWFLDPYLSAPVGIHVSAEAPASVAVGDQVELTIRVRNDGPTDRTLEVITIELGFIRGFAVDGVEPPFVSSEPATDHRVYRFEEPIPAGQVTAIRFMLRAIGQGQGQDVREGRVEVLFEGESRISSTAVSTAVGQR